jgi:glycerol uptake facilitator-like aquaporin
VRTNLLRRRAAPQVAAKNVMTLSRRPVAEVLGTTFLLAAVVGSGIMGEKLAGGNIAIALLANALATGATLVTLISHLDESQARTLIRQ